VKLSAVDLITPAMSEKMVAVICSTRPSLKEEDYGTINSSLDSRGEEHRAYGI
jgi:hypothetical protein